VKGVFAKKNFQVREKISPSALAFGCSHALVAEGLKEPSALGQPLSAAALGNRAGHPLVSKYFPSP
jgi:hypothetical protein